MDLDYSLVNLLILFGALQALIFCLVLLFQKSPGAKLLAAFVFVFAFNGFETFNWSSGLNHIFFDIVPFIVIFAGGPALFLYTSTLLYPVQRFTTGRLFAHFSIFLFQLITRIFVLIIHLLFVYKIVDSETAFLSFLSFTWTKAEPVSMIVFGVYTFAAVVRYQQATGQPIWKKISNEKHALVWKWVQSILLWSVLIAVAWLVTLTLPLILETDTNYYPIELLLVVFTYWVVLNGYHKNRLFGRLNTEPGVGIPATEAETHYRRLTLIMEGQKLFLDPTLNVSKLSKETGIPAKVISAVLNQHHDSNFNDFVNTYRLREVCRMLGDGAISQKFTIAGIALECGFNSQATFQRVFKTKMGVSPREYAQQVLRQSA